MKTITKQRDGIAELPAQLLPRLRVQLPQTLHDVPKTHLTIPNVSLETSAPETQSGRTFRWI